VELTDNALTFFADLFHLFDEDKDQALSPDELERLFCICPGGVAPWTAARARLRGSRAGTSTNNSTSIPADVALQSVHLGPPNSVLADINDFPSGVRTNSRGFVTLAGWLAEWSMITLLQPRLTLLYLYFFGFDRKKDQAICLTRPRSIEDDNNDLQRNVVRAFVFGAHGVGKSMLLDALIEGKCESWTGSEEKEKKQILSARNAVSRIKSQGGTITASAGKYFVLTKVPAESDTLEEALSNNMVDCDLAVMVFDSTNPSSVDWLWGLQKRIPDTIPCVYLATKIDLEQDDNATPRGSIAAKSGHSSATGGGEEDQQFASQAIEEASMLCASNSLPYPEPVSLVPQKRQRQNVNRLFELLLTAALRPDAARPISEERRAIQRRNRLVRASLRISLVLSVVASTGFFLWSYFGKQPSTQKGTEQALPSEHNTENNDNFRKV